MSEKSTKLLLTKIDELEIAALYEMDELIQLFLPSEHGYELSDIFVGKVKSIVPSINAAFVEFQKGKTGFLPLNGLHYESVLTPNDKKLLKCEDEILVQIAKEPIKTKDATLSTDITFSGEYFVIAPYSKGIHYSKKFSAEQKQNMWDLMSELVPVIFGQLEVFLEKYGIIVRTNAINASKEELLSELHDLFHKTSQVLMISDKRTVFSNVYKDSSFYEKTVKNIYKSQSLEIITDLKDVYYSLIQKNYENVRLYNDEQISLSNLYRLNANIENALQKQVWLKSGAYLVIEPTEAMTVIDVNSGKASAKSAKLTTKDEFILKVNIEAAKEIARQIRLRNLSGIIMIDFINMDSQSDKDTLMNEFGVLIKQDPVETTLVDMTKLDLVEVTRKKISSPLHERLLRLNKIE